MNTFTWRKSEERYMLSGSPSLKRASASVSTAASGVNQPHSRLFFCCRYKSIPASLNEEHPVPPSLGHLAATPSVPQILASPSPTYTSPLSPHSDSTGSKSWLCDRLCSLLNMENTPLVTSWSFYLSPFPPHLKRFI